ncbi:methyltransferase domain-containing protein [Nannocystaceae bacterium ST9]
MSTDASVWNARYAEGSDRWDLGRAPPILDRLIAEQRARRRVLVPGAGHGHDALAWARAGHRVVAFDIAPLAVASLRRRASEQGVEVDAREVDVLAPPVELRGEFDLVWEQTCLCALAPEQRRPYLQAMSHLLGPSGQMVALLWNHGNEGGPPWDMNPVLVEQLLVGLFTIDRREPVEGSIAERSPEWLWWLSPLVR